MQDKQWDDQFEDHAWSEMRRLLDREMPVAGPRRRRFAWAAWLLLLLVGMGIGWYGWSSGENELLQEEAPLQTPVLPDRPVAERQESRPDILSSMPAADAWTSYGEETVIADAPSPNTKLKQNPFGQQMDTRLPAITPLSTSSDSTPGLDTQTGWTENITENIQPDQPYQLDRGGKSTERSDTENAAPGHLRIFQVLSFLESRKLSVPDHASSLGNASLTSMRLAEQDSDRGDFFLLPDEWGVQGAVLAQSQEVANGVALGLAGIYRLGNSRWNLHTGLQYRYDGRDFNRQTGGSGSFSQDQTGSPNDPNTGVEDSGGGTNYQPGASYQIPGSGQLGALMQSLNLPVLLEYRLGNRIGIHTGVQLNYLLKATQRNAVEFTPNRFGAFNDQDLNALLSTRADQTIDNDLFHQFDLGVSTGLHYRFNTQWRLYFRYHYGLTDLLQSEYYETYNRYMGLGLTYFLK